ncbi:hypothetical protein SKAU_G00346300 [Synaphobranchus kaupii]|uniref:Reverse transcriptase domain-containing protein n=1 Tax=Synaphobranchus kaupii TaxID=118154 RepID=A0A9Q1EJM1_SYNKA|nr:hypothetical protein SKAU_G00346300 [Synaphobranchus kaupii]
MKVARKRTGKLRLCVNLTDVNKTIIPTAEELNSDFHGSKVFSKMDLHQSYLSVPLVPEKSEPVWGEGKTFGACLSQTIRATNHSSTTGVSPALLMFGQEMRTPQGRLGAKPPPSSSQEPWPGEGWFSGENVPGPGDAEV